MNYFKYQYQNSLGKIWPLFKGLQGAADECLERNKSGFWCDYGHTLEILRSAMNGNLRVPDSEDAEFDLRLYEFACQKTDNITRKKSYQKILTIVDTQERDDKEVGYGEVSMNKLCIQEDLFDEVEQSESFERGFNELLEVRSEYIVKKGIDPVELLRNAIRGIPSAITGIQRLCDEKMKRVVVSLCEQGSQGLLQSRLEDLI